MRQPPGVTLRTGDAADAQKWLDSFEAAGLDGVIAKKLGLPYLPGSRDGVLKVKPFKTADCVIVVHNQKFGHQFSLPCRGKPTIRGLQMANQRVPSAPQALLSPSPKELLP